ncbi:ROK family protein [Sporosarcina limicola]|uniref:Glucokinase n=1 Tax=Sporosarcina limicola TaxID=34101 RepID=A0A927MKB2_9BACL|nr:ROK family protein [Sporosarcina limicola]MBE1556309.1 glucokinase [Sporosarcina limicola]
MKYSIGVDIGGTNIAIAIVNQHGIIINETVIPTDLSIKPREMIDRVCEEIKNSIKKSTIKKAEIIGIGIGAPAPLDNENGVIMGPTNLKSWVDIPICELVEQSFSLPVTLENDANAAAFAEKWIGAAKENDNFTYITISTGIGAGIFVEGKLLSGFKGNAGEIGHTVIDPSFGQCSCGQKGCLESIASGTAIAKEGSKIMGVELSTKEIFHLYAERNPKIVHYIEDVFKVIGIACVNLINTFDPEKVVIGGGVSKVGDPLFESIRAYVSQYAFSQTGRETEIVPAKLNQGSGVIGAAALCFVPRVVHSALSPT